MSNTPTEPGVDPIDEEAADIDARSEDAAEEIDELRARAAQEGRDVEPQPPRLPEDDQAG